MKRLEEKAFPWLPNVNIDDVVSQLTKMVPWLPLIWNLRLDPTCIQTTRSIGVVPAYTTPTLKLVSFALQRKPDSGDFVLLTFFVASLPLFKGSPFSVELVISRFVWTRDNDGNISSLLGGWRNTHGRSVLLERSHYSLSLTILYL